MERSAAADSLFRLPRLSLPLRRPERFRPGAPAVREDPQPVGFGGLVLLPRPSPRPSPALRERGDSDRYLVSGTWLLFFRCFPPYGVYPLIPSLASTAYAE